jgi:hypothetical protein
MMRKAKGKSIRKTKKKLARPAKRTRSKASSRKKKPVRSQSQTAGVLAVEVAEVEIIGDIEQDFVDETEAGVRDPLDEHFPPDYGGSE